MRIVINRRLHTFAIGILSAFSLLVSAASACACSHHAPTPEPAASSCHSHAASEADDNQPVSENGAIEQPAADVFCICRTSVAKVFVKSEPTKLKLQSAAAQIAFTPLLRAGSYRHANSEFVRAAYLTDSFHNLAPKRGPPRL